MSDMLAPPCDAQLTWPVEVLVWRFAQLRRAGYEPVDASRLACALDVDLHRAIDFAERGCPHETVVRILL